MTDLTKVIPLYDNGNSFVPGPINAIGPVVSPTFLDRQGLIDNLVGINPAVDLDTVDFVAGTGPLFVGGYFWGLNQAGTFDRLRTLADNGDAQAALTLGLLATMARQQAWNGASWDRIRTPNVFKTAQVTAAGSTAIWTPAAGKKFRLMGYSFTVPGNASLAVAGQNLVTFLDNAVAIGISFNPYHPPTGTIATAESSSSVPYIDIKNGYLSILVNNSLNVNLVNALTGGNYSINVWGTEE